MSVVMHASPLVPIVTLRSDGSKIHEICGHKFKAILLAQPTFCSFCSKFIFGVGKQGYKCLGCQTVVHKHCHSFMATPCTLGGTYPRSSLPSEPHNVVLHTRRSRSASEEPPRNSHRFNKHFYTRPTFCDHCGSMLYGITKQGVQCADCHTNVHYRCQKKALHNCGIHGIQVQ